MDPLETQILGTDDAGIRAAAQVLRDGGLLAFATETVYGLGADARDSRAVARVFEAKGRPTFNPLIVHVSDLAAAERFAILNEDAKRLGAAFWPGPLSLVLPLRDDHQLSALVTAGLGTVAIRVPAHPIAQRLLEAFDGPIAAPSANPSGKISPTRAEHVLDGLNGKIEAVLDAGRCAVGLESTIVDPSAPPTLLRPGGLPNGVIEQCLNSPLAVPASENITAPGQLLSHYAPDASVRLDVTAPETGEFHIGFGGIKGDTSLSESGDLVEAASRLFDVLHQATDTGKPLAIAPIPRRGLGLAINDRLRRAAAPRDAQEPENRRR